MHAAPVAHHASLKAPLIAENVGQEFLIGGAVMAVHVVIGVHHTAGAALMDRRIKGAAVGLMERLLVHHLFGEMQKLRSEQVGCGKMFDRGDGAVLLNALRLRGTKPCAEIAVLGLHVLVSRKMRRADDVQLRRQQEVAGAGGAFLGSHLAEFIGHLLIPGTAKEARLGKARGLHDPRDAGRAVIHHDFGNTQPGHAPLIAGIADLALPFRLL